MMTNDEQFKDLARQSAADHARWQRAVQKALLDPEEVVTVGNFAAKAERDYEKPGFQEVVLGLATGRQYRIRMAPAHARALAEELTINAEYEDIPAPTNGTGS